jgi:hypothetical protein
MDAGYDPPFEILSSTLPILSLSHSQSLSLAHCSGFFSLARGSQPFCLSRVYSEKDYVADQNVWECFLGYDPPKNYYALLIELLYTSDHEENSGKFRPIVWTMCGTAVFSCSETLQKKKGILSLPEGISASVLRRDFIISGIIVYSFISFSDLVASGEILSYYYISFEAALIMSGWDPGIYYVANYVFVHLLLLISFITAVLMRSEGSKFKVLPCGAAHEGYKVFCLPFDAEFCLIRSLPILV